MGLVSVMISIGIFVLVAMRPQGRRCSIRNEGLSVVKEKYLHIGMEEVFVEIGLDHWLLVLHV